MNVRWVSITYPETSSEEARVSVQSFPVYYEGDVYLESEGPVTVLLYADGACVAVISGSACVHLCRADPAPLGAEDTEEEHFRALGWTPDEGDGGEVPHGD